MIYILFSILGFIYGKIICKMGNRLKSVVIWPVHSAFGITVLSISVWYHFGYNWQHLGQLALVFLCAFPGIFYYAQPKKLSVEQQLKELQVAVSELTIYKIMRGLNEQL